MVKLGFFVGGEYYEREDKEGHIEIAERILEEKKFWKMQFEQNSKYRDPVDFLIYIKGAIKIGNRYGLRIISYSSKLLDKETEGVILEYKSVGWKEEDVAILDF